MKTDDLIGILSLDTRRAVPLQRVLMVGLLPSLVFALLLVWQTLGFRNDLAQSLLLPLSAARFVLTIAMAGFGLRMAMVLARPEGRSLARPWTLAIVPAIALGLVIWTYIDTPAQSVQMAVVGKTITTCLIMIPILSILPVTAILLTLRQGATTAPRLASAVAGLGGAAAAAAIYATHCTEDSPLFYVTWYGLAILAVTVVSAQFGPRLLRW